MVQKFCEQNAMGSPLPTKSGRRQFLYGIRSASRKRFCWFRYLDDTFVVCSHGEVVMASFLTHLKNLHLRIQFTIHRKRKKSNWLPSTFWSPAIQTVHWVTQFTGHGAHRQVPAKGSNHPSHKQAVMKILILQGLCKPQVLHQELQYLKWALQSNNYTLEIKGAGRIASRPSTSRLLTTSLGEPQKCIGYLFRANRSTSELHNINTRLTKHKRYHRLLRKIRDSRTRPPGWKPHYIVG